MARGRAQGALGLALVAVAVPVAVAGAGAPEGGGATCAPKLTTLTNRSRRSSTARRSASSSTSASCEPGAAARVNAELRRKGKHPRVTRQARTQLGGALTSTLKLNKKGRKRREELPAPEARRRARRRGPRREGRLQAPA